MSWLKHNPIYTKIYCRIINYFHNIKVKNREKIFLISFPKSGRTWLRILIGYIIAKQFKIPFRNYGDLIEVTELMSKTPHGSILYIKHDDDPFWKTPKELETDKKKYLNSKVIFLARDPRDILISSYFEKTKRNKNSLQKYHGSLHDYIYTDIGGFNTIIKYYNIWAENRFVPKKFLLVRYEDLKQNTQKELKTILEFIGLKNINPTIINNAVEYASFENMQHAERQGSGSWRLSPGDKNDIDSYKTRKGKIEGYKDYLNEKEIEYLNNLMKKLSPLYKYKI